MSQQAPFNLSQQVPFAMIVNKPVTMSQQAPFAMIVNKPLLPWVNKPLLPWQSTNPIYHESTSYESINPCLY